mmetsp:Transcript_42861/g.100526  ORF Transcript_42861/g.100526 Transcript_42861/m.100526 type:complete len:1229 (+) Transcript_42861:59-3745(+)
MEPAALDPGLKLGVRVEPTSAQPGTSKWCDCTEGNSHRALSQPIVAEHVPQEHPPGEEIVGENCMDRYGAVPLAVGQYHDSGPSAPSTLRVPKLSFNTQTSVTGVDLKNRPNRPTEIHDKDTNPCSVYTTDMLDYMCSHIETLSRCIQDLMLRIDGVGQLKSPVGQPRSPLLPDKPIWEKPAPSIRPEKTSTTSHILPARSLPGPRGSLRQHSEFHSGRLTASDEWLGNHGSNSKPLADQMTVIGRRRSAGHRPEGQEGDASEDGYSFMLGQAGRWMPDKSWPLNVPLRLGLAETATSNVQKEKVKAAMLRSISTHQNSNRRSFFAGARKQTGWRSTCGCIFEVKDPNSTFVRALEMLCTVALLNDVIVTPYVLAWDVQQSTTADIVHGFSAAYWTLFMISRFFTGFYQEGELVMGRWKIFKQYLISGFLLDLALTTLDWILLLSPSNAGGQNVRALKMFRIMKVFRLARVWRLAETLLNQVAPTGTRSKLVVHLVKVALSTTIFSHMMSCLWYAFGRHGYSDTGLRWLERNPFITHSDVGSEVDAYSANERDEANAFFEYATCFHWTLAQLTLGSVDIYPANSLERMFNVALLLTGVLFNAVIVSLISSQAVEYIANRREQTFKFQVLRQFLDQHKVDTKLAIRVQRQVMERMNNASGLISEDEVVALGMISSALRESLMYEIRLPHVLGHELFRVWYQIDDNGLRTLCDGHVMFEVYKAQDFVFVPGQEASGMLRVADGHLRYTQDPETSKETEWVFKEVHKGDIVCEAGLWSLWRHVGKLECQRSCYVLWIAADGIMQTVQQYPVIGHITRQYGRAFHLRITCSRPPFSPWPSDLSVPNTNPSELLEQDIGLEMLRKERLKEGSALSMMSQEDYFDLVKEVEAEKCAIQGGIDGRLERVVPVFAIRIKRPDDDNILVEVGKYEKGKVTASVGLPGSKRPRGELPIRTYERVLSKDLSFVANGLTTKEAETQVEVKESQHFGLVSKYLRTVQHTELSDDFMWPLMPSLRQELPSLTDSPCADTQGNSRKPSRSYVLARNSNRRGSVGGSTHEMEHFQSEVRLSELSDEPVWLHEVGDKVRLYAWVSEALFDFVKTEPGKAIVSKWVAKMDVPKALEEFKASQRQPEEQMKTGTISNQRSHASSEERSIPLLPESPKVSKSPAEEALLPLSDEELEVGETNGQDATGGASGFERPRPPASTIRNGEDTEPQSTHAEGQSRITRRFEF